MSDGEDTPISDSDSSEDKPILYADTAMEYQPVDVVRAAGDESDERHQFRQTPGIDVGLESLPRTASLWGDAWRQLRRQLIFLISAVIIAILVIISVFLSFFATHDPR